MSSDKKPERSHHVNSPRAMGNAVESLERRVLFAGGSATDSSGLRGEYYDNLNLTDLKLTRVDPQLGFGWWQSAPDPSVGADDFSVRWTGQVLAPVSGTYTFAAWSSDGVRLWVNDQLVIDNWTYHFPTMTFAAPMVLQAGQKYNVRQEYFSGTGSAEVSLEWMAPGMAEADLIPAANLFTSYADPTGDTVAPTVPTNLQSPSRTTNSINLSWTPSTDNTGVTGYEIYRGGALVGSSTSATYVDGGLTASTAYSYTVRARDAAGNRSAVSAALAVSTNAVPPDTQAPTVPTALVGSALSPTSIALSWGAASDNVAVVGYDVLRNGVKIASPAGTTYTDLTVAPASSYTYTVAARDAANNVSATSAPRNVTTPANNVTNGLRGEYYDNPDFTDLKLTRTDANVAFGWWMNAPASSMGADHFSVRWTGQVQAPTTGSYRFGTWAGDGVRLWIDNVLVIDSWMSRTPDMSFSAPITLQAGQRYDVRQEYRSDLNSAEVSLEWIVPGASEETLIPTANLFTGYRATYGPTAPMYPAATVTTSDAALISWATSRDDLGVTGYDVYRNGTKVGTTAGTSFRDTGLSPSTTYAYTVHALDAQGNASPASAALTVATAAAGAAQSIYEAEAANASVGVTFASARVSGLDAGDYLRFNGVNLGAGMPTFQVYASVPFAQAGGQLEIRLDSPTGPVVGSMTLQPTGSTAGAPFVLQSTPLTGASGVRDVFVMVKAGTAVGTIDWVRFNPNRQVRVMPLGDSITQAPSGFASYRYFLYKRMQASGIDVDFVGSLTTNYQNGTTAPLYYDFDQNHEGHAGWRADEILAQIGGWAQAYKPDVVLIHLGSNDVFQGQSNASTVMEVGQIIDALRAVNPAVSIALAKTIANVGMPSQVVDLNNRLATLGVQKASAQSRLVVVDQWTGFSASADTFDGTHPNEGGERKMADRWHEALLELLR
jgi:chitodextrinase/lysophospholipase L1-like esterase